MDKQTTAELKTKAKMLAYSTEQEHKTQFALIIGELRERLDENMFFVFCHNL